MHWLFLKSDAMGGAVPCLPLRCERQTHVISDAFELCKGAAQALQLRVECPQAKHTVISHAVG